MAIVYLMRGLPGSGKSRTARTLGGLVIEPDRYFYNDGVYRYSDDRLPEAREWAFGQFVAAIDLKHSPIVLDRGNNADAITRRFARYAVDRGYKVELVEPDNALWRVTRTVLRDWADDHGSNRNPGGCHRVVAQALSARTMGEHRVPVGVILARMRGWRSDLTVDEIINPQPADGERE